MCTAQVRRINQETGRKVLVVARDGRPRWHEVFRNNPRMSNDLGSVRLLNGPGARPYIAGKTAIRWTWQRWEIEPGELYLTDEERAFGAPYTGSVLVEPATKVPNGNKAWAWERWQAVVDAFPGERFVQVGPPGARWLNGVQRVVTNTFREACAVLAVSRACVVPEGGMHHAAAALDVPAVVLYSEFISPDISGYATQRNIRHAGEACGSRVPCHGCKQSMQRITVGEVVENLRESL